MASSSTTAPSRTLLFASYALLALLRSFRQSGSEWRSPHRNGGFRHSKLNEPFFLLDDHGASTSKTKAIGEPPWRFDRH